MSFSLSKLVCVTYLLFCVSGISSSLLSKNHTPLRDVVASVTPFLRARLPDSHKKLTLFVYFFSAVPPSLRHFSALHPSL